MGKQEKKIDRPEPTLSTSDIAKYCRTSVVNVNRWIKSGELESYRYPAGRYKITKENFRKFLVTNNIPIVDGFFEDKIIPKILIGEDDKDFAKGLKSTISKQYGDIEIEVLEDGYEVLLRIGTFKPDMLILDIEIPTIDGLEVCSRIKEQEDLQDIKVLAITAHSEIYPREEVLKRGADELLHKPFSVDDLFQNIDNMLGHMIESINN